MTVILQHIGRYKLWLVLMGLCLFVHAFQFVDYLRFDRSLIEQWQLWRLLSGHITHMNWEHLFVNMLGLMIVAVVYAHYQSETYWLLGLIFMSLFCSAGLMIDMQLMRYSGMSGVLHGLFIIAAYWEYRRYKLSGAALMILVVSKLLWEQVYGALPGSESVAGGMVAINAHLYGAMAGGIYLLLTENVWQKIIKN